MLEISVRSADRLVRIVNDLLDLSKLEAGRMSFEPRLLAVNGVCEEVTAGLQAVANAREIRVVIDAPAGTRVFADHDQIVRVLTNLVGNAIKYSPPGSTVTLGGRAVGPGRGTGGGGRRPGHPRRTRHAAVHPVLASRGPGTPDDWRDRPRARDLPGDRAAARRPHLVGAEPTGGQPFLFRIPKGPAGDAAPEAA